MSLTEILVVVIVVLVVVGPEKIPELMRWMGNAMREVRRATNLFRDTMIMEEESGGPARLDAPESQLPDTPPGDSEPTVDAGSHATMRPVALEATLPAEDPIRVDLDAARATDAIRKRYLSPPHRNLY